MRREMNTESLVALAIASPMLALTTGLLGAIVWQGVVSARAWWESRDIDRQWLHSHRRP